MNYREIPYNYTSAEDKRIVSFLLDREAWLSLERLREKRVTGHSARLLMRFIGDIFIHVRNPFLLQEALENKKRRRWLMEGLSKDLSFIEEKALKNPDVLSVVKKCQQLLEKFNREIKDKTDLKGRIIRELRQTINKEDIRFDPFSLISHSTDATDWRLYLPVAVIFPTAENQIPQILISAKKIGLKIIPKGGGTGLTGGTVPLEKNCLIINTERLNKIYGIEEKEFISDGSKITRKILRLQAGVITQEAMNFASSSGLIFATDPTSAWACTIGGNIAENAGGKKAVLWGTAIDNLLSFSICLADATLVEIKRINHPYRKILPEDEVVFEISDKTSGQKIKTIKLLGSQIRKNGLWKDITNKVLGGLPGVQKEGTDGIITEAEFVLYPKYEFKKTLCLEFYGQNLKEASHAIKEIVDAFYLSKEASLMALEHFDDQYAKAIKYKRKANYDGVLKAVLLIDLVSHNQKHLERGLETISQILKNHLNTWIFTAQDKEEAEEFWKDRKKLGAIAARTNAFKLNEDIVIPLASLAEFADFIHQLNIAEEKHNQIEIIEEFIDLLKKSYSTKNIAGELYLEKIPGQINICENFKNKLEQTVNSDEILSVKFPQVLQVHLENIFQGQEETIATLKKTFEKIRSRVITIATHMHAGDGNVHVNIPVLSNDLVMLKRAELAVDQVMEKVESLNGVVSGEHGIGITKIKYLDQEIINGLDAYRKEKDPDWLINPGKLSNRKIVEYIYTPSFNILELEARILKHASLENLVVKISKCIRCGRCKPDCCVFYPPENLFYHPRNKNLAVGAIIEAILYDVQRTHSIGFDLLKYLNDVADYCTICHKCLKPCPVNIDTGEVSILERQILSTWGFKKTTVATDLILKFLSARSNWKNKFLREVFIKNGAKLQQVGVDVIGHLKNKSSFPLNLLQSKTTSLAETSLAGIFPGSMENKVKVIEPEKEATETVFYFPGCGSERLFSDISMASIYLLLKNNIRVIIPPPALCCGFPFNANAKTDLYEENKLHNLIVFSQIKEMFSYLQIEACVVSCGTCRETLEVIELDKIFSSPINDVVEFLKHRLKVMVDLEKYYYHTPCHDSLQGKANEVFKQVTTAELFSIPHCCSEAGTLAYSRPDIANAMRERKAEAITEKLKKDLRGKIILTNCPSCIQGLGRNRYIGFTPRHLTVFMANQIGGDKWKEELKKMVQKFQSFSF